MAMAPAIMRHWLDKTSPVVPEDELGSLTLRKEKVYIPCFFTPREEKKKKIKNVIPPLRSYRLFFLDKIMDNGKLIFKNQQIILG